MAKRDDPDAKGREIQDRDRRALALAALLRVVRETSIQEAVFPGRSSSTAANRTWALSRNVLPFGPLWEIRRRELQSGGVERYVQLTETGYEQADLVLGRTFLARKPVTALSPSHVLHDLDAADFILRLFPRQRETYVPKVQGKASGPAVEVETVQLPKRWRAFHVSVFKRLQILTGAKDHSGNWIERPQVAFVYEPDFIIETDTFNETRYLLEWDRGTEPICGSREQRNIEDKFRRYRRLVWTPWRDDPKFHFWHQRASYYRDLFAGESLRRPKLLVVTTSERRANNIREVAARHFADVTKRHPLHEVLEVTTRDQALKKLSDVLGRVEKSGRAAERPWEVDARARAQAVDREVEAAAKAEAERAIQAADAKRLKEEALRKEPTKISPADPVGPVTKGDLAAMPREDYLRLAEISAARNAEDRAVRQRQFDDHFAKLNRYLTSPPKLTLVDRLLGRTLSQSFEEWKKDNE